MLVAVGACAITGGVPALRNHLDLWDCFQEVYQYEPGTARQDDPERSGAAAAVRQGAADPRSGAASIISCPAARHRLPPSRSS